MKNNAKCLQCSRGRGDITKLCIYGILYNNKWQMYCGCFSPLHFLCPKWQCDYNDAYTTRCRIKNARDKWWNEIFIYAAYRNTHTPCVCLCMCMCVCVESEHTNHVQHINKCALCCWAFKLKTSRLHGIAETIWGLHCWCICYVHPVKWWAIAQHCTAHANGHSRGLYRYLLNNFTGYFVAVLHSGDACCFYFCFVCCTTTTMIAICKKRNAFGVHLHTHTHTPHTHTVEVEVTTAEWVSEKEQTCLVPRSSIIHLNVPTLRVSVPSGGRAKVFLLWPAKSSSSGSSCGNGIHQLHRETATHPQPSPGTRNSFLHLSVCLRDSHKICDPLDYYVVHVKCGYCGF